MTPQVNTEYVTIAFFTQKGLADNRRISLMSTKSLHCNGLDVE